MTDTRKNPVTHKDVTLMYMIQGINAVEDLLVNHSKPVDVLERVIENLNGSEKDTGDLTALKNLFAAAQASPGVRGRKPAQIGDSRVYTVQQVSDGECFIRLPLATLRLKKGDKVNVMFKDKEIVTSF